MKPDKIKWIFPCGDGFSYCENGICGRYNQLIENGNSKRSASRNMSTEWSKETGEDWKPDAILKQCEYLLDAVRKPHNRAESYTGDVERYTPGDYIELCRDVMGSIDLDPASCFKANKTVKADKIYDINDNGLNQQWYGNVFLNPPFKQPDITKFIEKLVSEWRSKNIQQAILLTNNNTDTQWFHYVTKESGVICHTVGRVKFIDKDFKELPAPTNGQTFFYFGENKGKFISEFSKIGSVLKIA